MKGEKLFSAAELEKSGKIMAIVDEFIQADKYVFVNPLWNFSLPAVMKAYIDNIIITGRTFEFSESGPIGLLKNKKFVHIMASGGVYENSPYDFANKYIMERKIPSPKFRFASLLGTSDTAVRCAKFKILF